MLPVLQGHFGHGCSLSHSAVPEYHRVVIYKQDKFQLAHSFEFSKSKVVGLYLVRVSLWWKGLCGEKTCQSWQEMAELTHIAKLLSGNKSTVRATVSRRPHLLHCYTRDENFNTWILGNCVKP